MLVFAVDSIDGKNLDTLTYWGEGIYSEGNNITVKENIVTNFSLLGIRTGAAHGGPYYTGVLVENNKVTSSNPEVYYYTYSGIYIQGSLGVVRGNAIDSAYRGIQIQPYTNPASGLGVVEDNFIKAYRNPLYFNYSEHKNSNWVFRNNVVEGMSVTADPVSEWDGLIIQTFYSGNVSFVDNEINFGSTDAGSIYAFRQIAPTGGTVNLDDVFANNAFERAVAISDGTQVTDAVFYSKIQAAIDAAPEGATINVGPGTYQEELTIGKSVTILGPNADISPNTDSRVAEAMVAPVNQSGVQDPAVTISNSNITVVIKGLIFDMSGTTDDSDRFVLSINQHDNLLTFEHNIYTGAPETINGYWYITGNTTPATINIIDNYFYANGVSNGIALWGTGQVIDISDNVWEDNQAWAFNLNNVTGAIQDNRVIDLVDGGPEWYENQLGFLFANAVDLDVTGNEFVGLPGTAIRIYDSVNGRLAISENSFTETGSSEYGTIRISDGADLSAVTVEFNRFIDNTVLVQNGSGTQQLDASPNWWGSADGPDTNQLVGDVGYNPWCGNEDCTELVVSPGGSIQNAIDDAENGTLIYVLPGTYAENLYIDKDVEILGAGAGSTIIQSPDALPVCFSTSYNYKAIVCIEDAVAELDSLTVDGLGKGNANNRFVGVAFHNAGGVLQNSEVLNIEDTPFSGTQHGLGIYGSFDDGERHLLSITDNTVQGFQKNGITFNSYENTPVIVDIVGNTVVGEGATSAIAQNGIQTLGYSVIVTIKDNVIRDIAYDNTDASTKWLATSILNYYANATIENNLVSGGHMGVYNIDAPATMQNNILSIEKVGVYAYGIIATDPPDAVPAGVDVADEDRAGAPANRQTALKVEIKDNEVTFVGDENTDTFGIEADSGYGPENLSVLMSGNIIDGFDYGISIYKGTSDVGIFTNVTAVDNCIYNSYSYGLWSNDDSITVNALNNFWGHATGPYHPTLNPLGKGGAVSESVIDFDPWSRACSKSVPKYEQNIFLPLFIGN